MISKKKALEMIDVIANIFPDAECELKHDNAFELTIAVLLSAQCTDNLVNRVTRSLFEKYKTPEDYLNVSDEELQNDIRSIGLYRNKAKNIKNYVVHYSINLMDVYQRLIRIRKFSRCRTKNCKCGDECSIWRTFFSCGHAC